MIASFNKKAQNQEIFTPEEYVTVQQLAELVSATELDFVKSLFDFFFLQLLLLVTISRQYSDIK